jgi:hypothetical protein
VPLVPGLNFPSRLLQIGQIAPELRIADLAYAGRHCAVYFRGRQIRLPSVHGRAFRNLWLQFTIQLELESQYKLPFVSVLKSSLSDRFCQNQGYGRLY